MQRLGRAEDGQVGERLDDDDHHVGAAEQADLRQCFRAEALAVEGPDRDPADHAALVGGGEGEGLLVADILVGGVLRNDLVGHKGDGHERYQQRGDVHAVLRQVERREQQALDQQAEREADRGRSKAEHQEQCGAEDEMNLGDADRIMRQHLEEAEHEQCRDHAADGKLGNAVILDRAPGQLGEAAKATGCGAVAEQKFRAVHDAGFDMHVSTPFPAPTVRILPGLCRPGFVRDTGRSPDSRSSLASAFPAVGQ